MIRDDGNTNEQAPRQKSKDRSQSKLPYQKVWDNDDVSLNGPVLRDRAFRFIEN